MAAEKDQEEKKNIFEKIGDALSSRDEKAAEEAARKAAEEAAQKKESEARIAAAKEQIRMQREAQEQRQKAEEAKKSAEEAAAKKLAEEKLAREKAAAEAAQARMAAQKAQAKPAAHADVDGRDVKFVRPSPAPEPVLAKYTIKEGDTLSGIAQKHYGHGTRDYWMVIYEANKATIGNNPGMIKPGVELTIPVLPAALQKD